MGKKPKKPTVYQYDCAKQVRDEAREYLDLIFPGVRANLLYVESEGDVGVAATIVGDTAPHKTEEVIGCLGELGVQQISIVSNPQPLGPNTSAL